MQIDAVETLKVPLGKNIELKNCDSIWVPQRILDCEKKEGKKAAKEQVLGLVEANLQKLVGMQELLWASNTHALLIILQGMDSAGKDGVISHVMSGVNPQGCEVHSFKTPSEEELDHNFLWRYMKVLPERGRIGIFNRSYYEDVLIVKVRPEILEKQKLPPGPTGDSFWKGRYEDINTFERHLVRNGTMILKFFLNISKEKQKQRLLKRLEEPEKQWKFSISDLSERTKWKEYMNAYQDVLNETNTKWAPWYIIPADKKWVAHAAISEIIVAQIEVLKLKYPVLTEAQSLALEKARTELEKE
jgi:PPK2 family polyphosphate:nucleotide phosphotransferase